MKERRARCFALGGGSIVLSWSYSVFFIVFYRSSWSQRKGASALVPFVSRQKTLATPAAMSGKSISCWWKHHQQYSTCYASTNISFFWRQKETKAYLFPQGSRRQPAAHKKQSTGCVLLKGKTMPLPIFTRPFFCFLFNSCWGEKARRLKSRFK